MTLLHRHFFDQPIWARFMCNGEIVRGAVLGWSAIKSNSSKQYKVSYLFDDGRELSPSSGDIEWSVFDA